MSIRPRPTQHERVMKEDDFIVSKTDLKSRITYGNRTFCEISGYSEAELLSAPHNILRHPDMPRAVFKLLWDRIQSKQEVCAYVKNLTKDGSFYWAFANVTPSCDSNGNIVGYFSVRRKPRPEAIQTISAIYRAMLEAERQASDSQTGMKASMEILQRTLEQKGMSYDEFVFGI